jgi:hypothetical protein
MGAKALPLDGGGLGGGDASCVGQRRTITPTAATKRLADGDPPSLAASPIKGEGEECQTSSTATAVASPPPMHRLAMPRVLPWRWSAAISVVMMRVPLAPMG